MISIDPGCDYHDRLEKLNSSFYDNIIRAKAEMVVEGSPVDYDTFKFICSIYRCYDSSNRLRILSSIMKMKSFGIDVKPEQETGKMINEYISEREKAVAAQNEFLDKFASKHTVQANS